MLITLVDIEEEADLREALRRTETRPVVYATPVCTFAQELIRKKLPCIFTAKTKDAGFYGADLVICGEEGSWRGDQALLERVYRRHYKLPWQIADTERLLIRESVPDDLLRFLAIYQEEQGNPDVTPFSGQPEEELRSYIANRYPFYGYGLWSVQEKESGRVIGRVGFEETEAPWRAGEILPELSYIIEKSCRGRGYAREAARAALMYAKEELGFPEVLLRTSGKNAASVRLAVSLGFCPAEGAQNFFKIDLTSHLV